MILQNHAQVKDLNKVQDRPMNFNVTECDNFIDMMSNSTLQLSFNKQLSFSIVTKNAQHVSQKAINIFLPFLIHICIKQNFLYISELWHYTATY